MATSSQYYRGASTPASHYQRVPSADEHLYAGLATSWHSPPHQAPGFSALLQRSSSTSQRQFPRPYVHYSGPSDYVNSHVQPAYSWSAHSFRPGTQEWSEALSDATFASRPSPYGEVEHRAPAPRQTPTTAHQHQHQHTSSAPHDALVSASGHAYPHAQRPHDHHLLPEHSPPATAPPYPSDAQRSAPVAHLLNHASANLQGSPPHAPPQVAVGWPAGSGPDVPPAIASPPQPPSHTSNTLSAAVVLSSHGHLPGQTWGMLDAGASASTSPVYERAPDLDPGWQAVETQPANGGYAQLNQLIPAAAAPQGSRRGSQKKNLARVPASFVQRQEKVKISKRNGPLDEITRQKTHRMRKKKNGCLRCRFFKVGCDDGEVCQRCLKVEGNARSFKQPCTRDRLEDAYLVRHCNGRSVQEEGEFLGYDWVPNSGLYDMEVMWNLPGYGPIRMARPFTVKGRQYYPKRSFLDTATSIWSNENGELRAVKQPPYAIYDSASLILGLERYYSLYQDEIEGWIFNRVRHDEVAWLTYHEVVRMRNKTPRGPRNLLDLALRLQCLSIVSQGYGTVCSENVPGIQEYDFGKMGRSSYEAYDRNSRDRPLPGQMSQQMDVAILKSLKKLEKLCAKELGSRIFQSKIKPWYELLLALFVLFWNLEYISRGAEKYILAKNGTDLEGQVGNVVRNQLKKWDWAFRVLLQHWAAVMRDFDPLKLARENPEELRINGHVDAEGFQFLMKLAKVLEHGRPEQYPNPYVGAPSTYSSLTSEWIRALFKEAGA